MKPERFKRTKSVVASTAIALVVAALMMGLASLVLGPRSTSSARQLGFALTSGPCAAISTSPPTFALCGPAAGTGPLLYPGAPASTLPLTIYNPLSVGIDVTQLTVSFAGTTFPTGCISSNFHFGGTPVNGHAPVVSGTQPNVTLTFPIGGYVHVNSGSMATPTTAVYDATLALADSGNQDKCKNLALSMAYTATAQYTEVYGTSSAVTSSLNPSTVGNAVTYTATVTASAGSGQDPVPSSPTGTVTFYDGTVIPAHIIAGCSGVAVSSATKTTAKATCASPVYGSAGTHAVTAVYANTDGNFSGATSPVFTQTVNLVPTSLTLTTSPNSSAFGQSVTLSAQTAPATGPTGTVSFYQCSTATCSSTFLLGTGPLNASGATFTTSGLPPGTDYLQAVYGGDTHYASAKSNVVAQSVNTAPCITTTVTGSYVVKSGQAVCFGSGSRVNGGVTVLTGGALVLNGATINGGITATGASALRICGSTVNGNILATGTTGFVVIGDRGDDGPPGCAANTISGNVTLTGGKGGFEFAGNKVIGTVTFTSNTGASPMIEDGNPEVEGNTITGALSCVGNSAVTDGGQKNTATGAKTGQCAGSGF